MPVPLPECRQRPPRRALAFRPAATRNFFLWAAAARDSDGGEAAAVTSHGGRRAGGAPAVIATSLSDATEIGNLDCESRSGSIPAGGP